jgi:hypothetical protein
MDFLSLFILSKEANGQQAQAANTFTYLTVPIHTRTITRHSRVFMTLEEIPSRNIGKRNDSS